MVAGWGRDREPCGGEVMTTRWAWLLSQSRCEKRKTSHILSTEVSVWSTAFIHVKSLVVFKPLYSFPVLPLQVLVTKTWTLFWKVYSERPLFTVCNFIAPQGPHVLRDLKKDGGKVDVHGCGSVTETSAKESPYWRRERGETLETS